MRRMGGLKDFRKVMSLSPRVATRGLGLSVIQRHDIIFVSINKALKRASIER